MAKINAIEAELQKATKVKPKEKENRADYLIRLHAAVLDLADGDWDNVSEAGQKWYNAATRASDNDKAIPDFVKDEEELPLEEAAAEEEPEAETETDEKEEPVASTKTKKAAKAPAKAKAEKTKPEPKTKVVKVEKAKPEPKAKTVKAPAKAKAAAKGKKTGGMRAFAEYVVKHPTAKVQDIIDNCEVPLSKSLVSSGKCFFGHFIQVLQKRKLLTKELLPAD